MAENLGLYTPGEISLTINQRTIEGFAEGEFIRTERNNEDEFTVKVGAKGDFTFVENLDKSGRLIIVLKQNAPDNTYLQSLLDGKVVFPFNLEHQGTYKELAGATFAMIGSRPRKTMGQEELNREWFLVTGRLIESDKAL